jgi:gliding-associated putative ABC transporter substrate-binding component GldG
MAQTNKKTQSLIQLALFAGIVVLLNVLANARIGGRSLYAVLDLTEDKHFTLTEGTKNLLRNLDEVVDIKVLLDGKFPAGFKRLQNSTRDLLDDFRSQSSYFEYSFENPTGGSAKENKARLEEYRKDGIAPISLTLKVNGETTQRPVFPYAIINYKGRTAAVNLLENEIPGVPDEVVLNNAIGLLEYKIADGIQKLQRATKPVILFTAGHGELNFMETADLEKTLRKSYLTGRVNLDSMVRINQKEIAALVIAKPRSPFSEKDKFKIDQYVMNGGKVVWLIDKIAMDLDSLTGRADYVPTEYDLKIDDLLFRYGVRIQPDLALDFQCTTIKLVTGRLGSAPQFTPFNYPYHIVSIPQSNNPIVKSLGPVNFLFANTIDTLRTKTSVKKTILLTTTEKSRIQYLPVRMNFDFLKYELDPTKFTKGRQALAVLLEGEFPSLYENRVSEDMTAGMKQLGIQYKPVSSPNRMVVVADGDIARNKFNLKKQQFSPLGYNEFVEYRFANKDFLMNTIEYLLDDNGVIAARGKDVKLRLLNTSKAKSEREYWQFVNIGLPLIVLSIFGVVYQRLRRRRYAQPSKA